MIDLQSYITAGNATFTIRSRKTGTRFTYRVRRSKDEKPMHFVSVLAGPQNEHHYEFLGTIFNDGVYRHGRKSRYMATSPCSVAFAYLMDNLSRLASTQLDFYPSAHCCACGRLLTTPESVALGIGPECGNRLGGQHESKTQEEQKC